MSRNDELRALAQRLADALPAEAIEVVLTGISRGIADEVSDVEMLVVTEEQPSLQEAFALARRAGLEGRDRWGDPSTPARRVSGYLDGQPVETVWWSRELAEELFATGGSAEALASGVALRTSGLLARSQERVLAIVFALNRVPQPTAKRLAARVEPLAIKPEWLAERIEEALAEPHPRTGLRLMAQLQLDAVRLAPDGPNVERARTWLAEGLEVLG